MHPMTYNETEQVIEHGDRFRDNPWDDPDADTDGNPGSNGKEASAVHLVGTTEKADVDVLARNVTQDNTGENDLDKSA